MGVAVLREWAAERRGSPEVTNPTRAQPEGCATQRVLGVKEGVATEADVTVAQVSIPSPLAKAGSTRERLAQVVSPVTSPLREPAA
jgi:hypothetical protein